MTLTIRVYEPDDYPCIAKIFDKIWGWELEDDAQLRASLALFYAGAAVLESSRVLVADLDGSVAGVCCVKADGEESCLAYRPDPVLAAALAQSRIGLQKTAAGRQTLEFYRGIDTVNQQLDSVMSEQGLFFDAEIKLLITDPDAQGRGVGRALQKAALEYLSGLGSVRAVMLKTDTHCAWQFYEHTGWTRAAQKDWIFSGEKITAFAYRRTID